MLALYNPNHELHQNPAEIFDGKAEFHQERPERLTSILATLSHHQLTQVIDETVPAYLGEVHSDHYVAGLQRLSQASTYYHYPSVFVANPALMIEQEVTNLRALQGQYSFDMYTPVHANVWPVAVAAAQVATQAAEKVLGGEQVVYGLMRPPGHHAQRDRMGGYCYFNNAAVAAQTLRSQYSKVAILDIDYHHGNGTQDIFYQRDDVFTVSLHANPDEVFPFFSGRGEETGIGVGQGANLNLVLPMGATESEYQARLDQAYTAIQTWRPEALVVSFGADTHQADPIGSFKLSTPYYQTMAETINSLNVPTVIIQEGGYNTDTLGEIVATFLEGF